MIFWEIVILVVGMVLLIKGADFFVDGSSRIAKALRIPSLIIGLTLVSMGTSAPELSVSISAALSGSNDISLGNVVGSNAFNTLLILGLSAIVIPLVISKDMKKYDIPIMVFIYGILLLFGVVITPLELTRLESIVLLVLFVAYMLLLFFRAKNGNDEETEEGQGTINLKMLILSILIGTAGIVKVIAGMIDMPKLDIAVVIVTIIFIALMFINFAKGIEFKSKASNIILSIVFTGTGLVAIVGGGTLVVDSASNIAQTLGMSEALVGLTIVAIGTSLPELVTSVVASLKHENDIAVGNVIGSNIFNVLLILGTTSTIRPLTLSNESIVDLIVLFVSGALVLLISCFSKNMKKWQGASFVLLYVGYLVYIILRNYM